ncbi:hypothetical protein [Criblamydia sequanensis]|uniref:Conserved putative membrane protein n=1 Tax=Candidatus Criblamydia sequanensis CRIB-18 TaxID=1437425 RepID=A0A090E0C4_9BACT|nr:hypothetical protein [Criblamydia sequanensis]CDR34264.1 Conserved putative membrane protein [Criblamydia sequanensis CRIB-18]
MTPKFKLTRQSVTISALLVYSAPLIFVLGFSKNQTFSSWTIFSIALLILSAASLIHLSLLFNFYKNEGEGFEGSSEKENPDQKEAFLSEERRVELEELENLRAKEEELREEISYRNEELLRLTREKEFEISLREQLEDDFDRFRKDSEDRLAEEKILLQEYAENISSLRASLEERQEENERLQSKIRDMAYEIKTLVDLADVESEIKEFKEPEVRAVPFKEMEPHGQFKMTFPDFRNEEEAACSFKSQVRTEDEAKKLLKRCLDIAQKITVSHHFTNEKSRFRDLPFDNHGLDLRRLCDSLRSETTGAVLVYSQKENRILFINNQIRALLGFGPDKFVQDFENIVQGGLNEWKSAIAKMNTLYEAEASLVMKNKAGQDVLLRCQLGLIPTGVFRNSAIGVFYNS